MILEDIFSYSDTGPFMRFLSFFNSYKTKVMITIIVISILILCMILGALWVLFQKADKKGYLAIIPFYNIIEVLHMTGLPGYHFLLLLIPFVNIYSFFVISKELARVFKQKPSYGLLIFFFPYIFLLKLALGNSEYDRNYYYKSVNDSSNSQYVIVNTEIDDYNQGLVFDPKTNVDDVVKSAPYDPTLSNFFREKDESENEFMAFLDMSDDARMNEENNVQPGGFTAAPNNILNEIPQSETPAEPNKMSVEALMGRPTTEDINVPKPEPVQAPQVDMNNLFNVGMAPAPEPQNNVPSVEMNNVPNMAPPVVNNVPPVTNTVAQAGAEMVQSMAPQVNEAQEEESINEVAQQNINDDINKILGLDVNNIESVPVPSTAPEIPTLGGDIMPPTNPMEIHQTVDLSTGGNNLVQNAVDFASTQTPQEVATPTMCPNCGTTLPAGAKFCYMCGKAI